MRTSGCCAARPAPSASTWRAAHGLKGRIYRLIERIGDERALLLRSQTHLQRGGLVMAVPTTDESTTKVVRILGSHGGHDMAYFGRGQWQRVGTGAGDA